jgi:hypothetical protein
VPPKYKFPFLPSNKWFIGPAYGPDVPLRLPILRAGSQLNYGAKMKYPKVPKPVSHIIYAIILTLLVIVFL